MGIWCSLGRTLDEFERGLREGRSGRGAVGRFDVTNPYYRTTEAAVLAQEERLPSSLDQTRIADLTLVTACDALRDAGLAAKELPPRCGLALGTSHGGNIAYMKLIRGRLGQPSGAIDHELALCCSPTVVGQVARAIGVTGPTVTISTACASGTNAVGRAAEMIRAGHSDTMLAGGADLFTELSFSGFNMLGALARGPCRPLDRDRDGLMLGDGAAMLVLEHEHHARRRGARIWGFIGGHSIGNEAWHATAPRPDGSDAARVMSDALRAAHMDPCEIDYINLHGTGTAANDAMELAAVATVFGSRAEQILLSSTKSQIGHTLGAAGSIELVATILGMARGFAPPTINLANPMQGYEDWAYVRDVARPATIRAALSNSFGFSGNLSSIAVRRVNS
jgi:3-oxoacyl-[acyl-carrier-protein] synthase II